jgi:hypothetical protein
VLIATKNEYLSGSEIVIEQSSNGPKFEGFNLLPLVMIVNSNNKCIVQFASGSDIVIEQSTYDPMFEGLNPAALDTES